MVIDDEGTQLGLTPISEAIALAGSKGLDLVEVAPQADPPVCRFMDYGKFKYKKNKKAHEAKKHQKMVKLKEIKITPKTSTHDYQFKLKHIIRFLNEGNKAKVTVFFRGRQITHTEPGKVMLDRVIEDTKEFASVGQAAKMEGRRMNIILEPRAKVNQPANSSGDGKKEEKGEGSAKD
ncbi:MAG: translation initiation factor IF-3 [bacterium]|nr:MAG: translation initiation factor IF-3 [bacterium]